MDLNLDQFSPKQAELTALAAEAKAITINGLDDKAGYQLAYDTRQKLKKTRVEITKSGKELRDDAVKFQRAVIAREKELIAIIEPEEERLAAAIEEIDTAKARELRRALLPERRAKLDAVNASVDENDLLDMTDNQFNDFYGKCVVMFHELEQKRLADIAAEQEREEAARQRAQAELAAEKAKIAAQQAEAEARIAAEEKRLAEQQAAFEREQAEAKARAEREAEEAKARAEREEAEVKRIAAENAKKMAADKKLQAFLKEHGASKESIAKGQHIFRQTTAGYSLYQLVAALPVEA